MASAPEDPPPAEAPSEARTRILAAALGLFVEKGYPGVSTLEIARRAKVSKRDLYALVGNKEEIFRACVATRARRMTALYEAPAPTSKAALAETLTRLGAGLLAELTHPAVIAVQRLVIASPAGASPELGEAVARVGASNTAAIAGFLAGAQGNGLIAAGDTQAMADLYLDLLGTSRLMLRALDGSRPAEGETYQRAAAATDNFLRLHGA